MKATSGRNRRTTSSISPLVFHEYTVCGRNAALSIRANCLISSLCRVYRQTSSPCFCSNSVSACTTESSPPNCWYALWTRRTFMRAIHDAAHRTLSAALSQAAFRRSLILCQTEKLERQVVEELWIVHAIPPPQARRILINAVAPLHPG